METAVLKEFTFGAIDNCLRQYICGRFNLHTALLMAAAHFLYFERNIGYPGLKLEEQNWNWWQ